MCKTKNFLFFFCNREIEIEKGIAWDKYNPQFSISVHSLLIYTFPAG